MYGKAKRVKEGKERKKRNNKKGERLKERESNTFNQVMRGCESGENRARRELAIVGGHAWVFFGFHFKLMQKFCFQYQFEGKGLWNNFGSSVKQSD